MRSGTPRRPRRIPRTGLAAVATACLAIPLLAGTAASAAPDVQAPAAPSSPTTSVVDRQDAPRTVITTDPELDDLNSMLRMLLYSNEINIAGLVYSSSQHHYAGDPENDVEPFRWPAPDDTFHIDTAIDAYEKVYDNLRVHDADYPAPASLRDLVAWGNVKTKGDMAEDTDGSDLIKGLLLDDEPGQVFLEAWGGANTIARALRSIQDDYEGTDQWEEIHEKVQQKAVLTSFGQQDDTFADYIRPNWPALEHREVATSIWGYGARGSALDEWQKYLGPEWMKENVSDVGPIGAEYRVWGDGKFMADGFDDEDYFGFSGKTAQELEDEGYMVWTPPQPKGAWISEGDSSNFALHVQNGLRNAEDPSWGGWGGRQERNPDDDHQWRNSGVKDAGPDGQPRADYAAGRWFEDFQLDLAARLQWSVTDDVDDANHAPVSSVAEGIDLELAPGQEFTLDGEASDPDGDEVGLDWYPYREASTYDGEIVLDESAGGAATFTVPEDAEPGDTIHLILEASDTGTPAMKSYQRVVVTVGEKPVDDPDDTRPRTIVTQDGEIDDMDSFVRFLYYSNEYDIEGIVQSSSMFHWRGEDPDAPADIDGVGQCGGGFSGAQSCTEPFRWTGTEWLQTYLDDYEKIYPNLAEHADGYPTPDYLRSVTKIGNVDYSSAMAKDTEGSDWIKRVLLDDDPRPVYVQTWGGLNTLARALKSIEDEYEAKGGDALAEVREKISDKVVIYNILNQDNTLNDYIKPAWPGIEIVDNQSQFWSFAYQWPQKTPDEYKHTLQSEWMRENLLTGHGDLLAGYHTWGDGQAVSGELPGEDRWTVDTETGQFPTSGREQYDFISEGDTPSYLFLLESNGLRNSEDPTWGGWGGRFEATDEGWLDTADDNPFTGESDRSFPQTRWTADIQNDFAARADWGVAESYEDANHNPVAAVEEGLDLTLAPGEETTLHGSAEDPDGDAVALSWSQYADAGTYKGDMELDDSGGGDVSFTIPEDAKKGDTLHLLLEAADGGAHTLKHWQRVVVTVGDPSDDGDDGDGDGGDDGSDDDRGTGDGDQGDGDGANDGSDGDQGVDGAGDAADADGGDVGSGDGDLAVTGGEVAWAAALGGALLLLLGGGAFAFSRRRRTRAE